MPCWSSDLPAVDRHNGYDLRRTPTDRPLRAVITCDTLNVTWTHYWGGRTRPCEAPDCDACNHNSPRRAHCYVSAYDPTTREHFLFESTAAAARAFADWVETYGTLRGCYFQAHRPKRRRNAKVEIVTKPWDQTKGKLPEPPDVARAMCVIWQIPAAAVQQQGAIDGQPALTTDRHEVDKMRLNAADVRLPQPCRNGNGSH